LLHICSTNFYYEEVYMIHLG